MTKPSAPAAEDHGGRTTGRARVLVLASLIAGLAYLVRPPSIDLELVTSIHLEWWMLALLFWAAEAMVVHIEFRRHATSFSVSEIPLLFGLAATAGPVVVAAQVAGTLVGLVVHRRQPPVKLAFNAAQIMLGGVVAVRVAQALVTPGADITDPLVGGALMLAAMVATSVNVATILLAITVTEGSLQRSAVAEALRFGLSSTFAAASAGLAGVVLLAQAPWMPLLLIPTIAVMAVASTAYASTRRSHERVSFLYAASRSMAEAREFDAGLSNVLGAARGAFRARVAELTLFEPDPDSAEPLRLTLSEDAEPSRLEPLAGAAEMQLVRRLAAGGAAIVRTDAADDVAGWLRRRGMTEALVAPLVVGDQPIGMLLIADRLGDVTDLTEDDLQLFTTLTEQLSVALENGRLERTLAHVTELKEELAHRATHDALTSLANRPLFHEIVDAAVDDEPLGVALLYLDLDDFKAINDQFGHDTGDLFLRIVADRIGGALRPGDLAGRLGGDEFGVLVHVDDPARDAQVVADRIRTALSEPIRVVDQRLVPRASIGIALGRRGETRSELMRRADTAMYAAKRGGGGIVVWSDDLADLAPSADRLTVRQEFSRDLESGRIVAWHQPIVDLATRRIVASEALVRWNHPERGLLLPDEFLSAAASGHLERRLTEVVLRSSAETLRAWPSRNGRRPAIALNLAPNEVAQGLADRLRSLTAAAGLGPGDIIVEVTEHEVVAARGVARAELAQLRSEGFRVAIDDFGTGYSSLGYLRDLPADIVKLAKELVDDIDLDAQAADLARGVVDLSHSLGLTTLAEGIERESQLRLLAEWGCSLGQGYHLGRPSSGALAPAQDALTNEREVLVPAATSDRAHPPNDVVIDLR